MTEAAKPLKVAILAMGGQGGGVLANWLIEAAERSGCLAQSTAVPGVAQRTGATVYYLEIVPGGKNAEPAPVLALMPVPGHVDVVVAGELAEAGRALQRGLITPQRTAAIVSTHRDYAIDEKSAPADGRVDSERLAAIVSGNARQYVGFDMAALAEETGSVISSVLLGAIAGAGALPIGREVCEAVIRAMGVAVEANLRGFDAGYNRAQGQPERDDAVAEPPDTAIVHKDIQALLDRVREAFPEEAQDVLTAALRRLVDYQDLNYANDYLDRLAPVLDLDGAEHGYRLTVTTARYLALGMTYEDVIRVADLKTRSKRFERVRSEVQAEAGQVVAFEEFMHPRVEEICDVMPARIGAWCLAAPSMKRLIGVFCRKGRRIRTTSLPGFLLLYAIAGLRRLRRTTLRYRTEINALERWLALLVDIAPDDYDLAVEVAECRRLVKGYGETHARGLAQYDRLVAAIHDHRGEPDAAASIRTLRDQALAIADIDSG
ncbi:MAG: indolepyruvate oxidoreductase subunit beta family protein [Gammaproteobacteria bacterium]|nr:indolepyruvate oxidoreductase subunit beta family protein [Gammaproteobacteria bacterium]